MIEIIPMEPRHLDAVYDIELASFSVPWSKKALSDELTENNHAYYFVAVSEGAVIGYAGMWHIVNEGHVTNIAVAPEHRRQGVGAALLDFLINEAYRLEMVGLMLEVRVGNYDAQRLYTKNGFVLERIRKNYYSDTGEDALVMWKSL